MILPLSGSNPVKDLAALDVIIIPNPLVTILSVTPVITSIREDQISEAVLYYVNASDQSLPGDTISCTLDSTPTSDNFLLLNQGSGVYAISIRESPVLQFSAVPEYSLSISCSDQKDSVNETFGLYVTENKAPEVTNLPASREFPAPLIISGDVIYEVSVYDPEHDSITHSLACVDDPCYFSINRSDGTIIATEDFSSVGASIVELMITVDDGFNTVGPLTLSVTITDLNEPPVITNLPSDVTVSENSALSSSVYDIQVSDNNTDDTHTYTATFVPESGEALLAIDPTSGVISTSSSQVIDYEALTGHTIVMSVTVSDGNAQDVKELIITVTNQNEPPEFQYEDYSISGNEGEAGTMLDVPINYGVIDPDIGTVLSFSMDCPPFSVESTTGSVSLGSAYDVDDPEASTNFICTLTVSDGQLSDTSSLHITLNNINDNSPTFDTPAYDFSTVADVSLNTVIGSVTATDGDVGELGTFTYQLDQTSLESEYFRIDENGSVFVKESLLTFVSGTSFTAIAMDVARATGTTTITVTIQNSPPVITNLPLDPPIPVAENSAQSVSVFQVSVEDVNSGDTHTYSATFMPETTSNLFTIDTNNGLISTTSETIDYEALADHTIVMSVTVSDGNAQNVKELSITVTNQNEPPEFQYEDYSISGNEGEAETMLDVPNYRVSDPDIGTVLSFSMDCPPFSVESNTGFVFLSSAYDVDDPEASTTFTCTLSVSDGQLSDTSSLHITLNNINDNSPTFDTPAYDFSTVADVPLNTVIGSVTATDGDVGEFGTFAYQLDQSLLESHYFGIYENGSVFVKESLLTFVTGSTFIVIAKDVANATGMATITVAIQNSPPIITNLPLQYPLAVPENSGLSVSVFHVLVEDVNSGDAHTYSATFTPEAASVFFSIDTNDGLISSSSSATIDFEALSEHTIVMSVTVSDGNAQDVKELYINVTNENEPPEFQQDTYSISGDEGEAEMMIGSPNYGALDPDSDSTLSFSMNCPPFSIDPSIGYITLSVPYDVDVPAAQTFFSCVVTLSDGQLSDTASLLITINNINDNSPTFSASNYEFSVFADVAPNTVIGSVTATDRDVGDFGTFTYRLNQTQLGLEYFGIYDDGRLFVTESLLTFTTGSSLTIIAKDKGDLEDTATITVVILNSAPVISNLPRTTALQVSENSGLSVSVFQVSIEDANSGDTHTYSATFTPDIASTLFSIDSNSGVIYTSAFTRIDFESLVVKTIVMHVMVSDGKGEDTKNLAIEIIDVNEAPQFARNDYHVYGNEGKAGDTFGRVSFEVDDPDTMSINALQISSSCAGFQWNSETKEIIFGSDYDADVQGTPLSVTCEVTVSDGQLSDTASLVLHVNNINDNSPVFINDSYSFTVKVNASIGTLVGSVSAVDNDLGEYGLVSYDITGQNEIVKYFTISENGDLTTKDLLPIHFSAKLLEFGVVAEDVGERTDEVSVLILVEPTSGNQLKTRDRHRTFFEDSRSFAWLVPISVALALCFGLMGYVIIRHVILPRSGPKSNAIDRWVEPRKKGSKPATTPSSSSVNSPWEPWHVRDF
uniref:Protein dachsous-like n=1 Tax=Crassostrea virginica TaxID=6565 RepID=A0A8B8B638_CRAVI|nr:protein dachsous-like [Crassostrea virginica]